LNGAQSSAQISLQSVSDLNGAQSSVQIGLHSVQGSGVTNDVIYMARNLLSKCN
jgi:hypothetical protein